MTTPTTSLLNHWQGTRAELAAIERAEHPPVTDHFGRLWVWKDGDLYVHDGLLAMTLDQIKVARLPRPGLADENPNYAGLCDVCRHEAPVLALAATDPANALPIIVGDEIAVRRHSGASVRGTVTRVGGWHQSCAGSPMRWIEFSTKDGLRTVADTPHRDNEIEVLP